MGAKQQLEQDRQDIDSQDRRERIGRIVEFRRTQNFATAVIERMDVDEEAWNEYERYYPGRRECTAMGWTERCLSGRDNEEHDVLSLKGKCSTLSGMC